MFLGLLHCYKGVWLLSVLLVFFLPSSCPLQIVMDMCSVRAYLALPPRASSALVMRDALQLDDPGAAAIVKLIMQVRVNRRSRRTMARAREEFLKSARGKWFNVLEEQVWNSYRLLLGNARK